MEKGGKMLEKKNSMAPAMWYGPTQQRVCLRIEAQNLLPKFSSASLAWMISVFSFKKSVFSFEKVSSDSLAFMLQLLVS